jgi:hypothetical protein
MDKQMKTPAPAPNQTSAACCAPPVQATCCAPQEKAECCGDKPTTAGCGCQ